jgi:hypothetical protein
MQARAGRRDAGPGEAGGAAGSKCRPDAAETAWRGRDIAARPGHTAWPRRHGLAGTAWRGRDTAWPGCRRPEHEDKADISLAAGGRDLLSLLFFSTSYAGTHVSCFCISADSLAEIQPALISTHLISLDVVGRAPGCRPANDSVLGHGPEKRLRTWQGNAARPGPTRTSAGLRGRAAEESGDRRCTEERAGLEPDRREAVGGRRGVGARGPQGMTRSSQTPTARPARSSGRRRREA